MSQYYSLQFSANQNEVFIEEQEYPDDLLVDVVRGKSLKNRETSVRFINRRKSKILTDYLGSELFVTVSPKFMEILKEMEPDYLEFYSADVFNTFDQETHPYWLVNVLETLDVMDREESDYEPYPGGKGIETLDSLVLDHKAIGNRNVFRVFDLESDLFVSEKVKNKIEEAKMTGVIFTPESEFTLGGYY